MIVEPLGHSYPEKEIRLAAFPGKADDFHLLFPPPPGMVEDHWPPTQLTYLGHYLANRGCRTVLSETHYVDRDYIEDLALFYGRSLRNFPNYCQRLHFFTAEMSDAEWRSAAASTGEAHELAKTRLQESYLGFSVVRPLPASPIGRTVLKTYDATTAAGERRVFDTIRQYAVHLASFRLELKGLAFQQQDRGVSACATTALWCAIQSVAPKEGLGLVSPATITESASRYFLADGRALPSEGLTIHQICEATRAAGLSPLVVRSIDITHDRAQLLGYLSSGFAPVLALKSLSNGEGHAVCGVGLKLGEAEPSTDPDLHFRDAQTAIRGVYVHDDRLGPYASAELFQYTLAPTGRVVTGVNIKWPDRTTSDTSILTALVIPVPNKLRLTVTRKRALGLQLANAVAQLLSQFDGRLTLNCYFKTGVEYLGTSAQFGLSGDGLYDLTCETVLSRYIGVIALVADGKPLVDFLLDTTESGTNPAVLACVQRARLNESDSQILEFVANRLATRFVR